MTLSALNGGERGPLVDLVLAHSHVERAVAGGYQLGSARDCLVAAAPDGVDVVVANHQDGVTGLHALELTTVAR